MKVIAAMELSPGCLDVKTDSPYQHTADPRGQSAMFGAADLGLVILSR